MPTVPMYMEEKRKGKGIMGSGLNPQSGFAINPKDMNEIKTV
jgi:hypothetical protein